jgi:serine/threonine-protein kinase
LPDILKGEARPSDAAECLTLADLCQQPHQRRYAASARFFGDAFTAEPKLADNLFTQPRHNAACAAALAGCGQAKDVDKLDAKERASLRRQALDWLRADLKAYRQLMEKFAGKPHPAVAQRMQHWLQDDDFAGVRGAEALGKLPEGERQPWQQMWADVADTLARARGDAALKQKPDTK